jgi:hypothetical protein
MTNSKDARQHALERHVHPARIRKESFIDLSVDEIQMELGWQKRTRQVISALWANDFEELARVRNLDRPGPKPPERSGVVLHFEILA